MPKSQAYIGHLMILATTFIYSFNTNFMKVIIPEWIGPNVALPAPWFSG